MRETRRALKRFLKKLTAFVLMMVVLCNVMPIAVLEGVFDLVHVKVLAAEEGESAATTDPFDTSKLTVVSIRELHGPCMITACCG